MPYFQIPSSQNNYETLIRMLEAADPASNTVFNTLFQQLINNETYLLNRKVDTNGTSAASWRLRGKDTRSESLTPEEYMKMGNVFIVIEFKYAAAISLPASSGVNGYVLCFTLVPWGDQSGGRPVQLAACTVGIYARPASSDTVWGGWKTILLF